MAIIGFFASEGLASIILDYQGGSRHLQISPREFRGTIRAWGARLATGSPETLATVEFAAVVTTERGGFVATAANWAVEQFPVIAIHRFFSQMGPRLPFRTVSASSGFSLQQGSQPFKASRQI